MQTIPEYKKLVKETSNVFNLAITQDIPDELKSYLEKDVFVFSGLRTHAQLAEARSYLKGSDGNIIPYHQFQEKILKLNEKYNLNYLDAEYQFAQTSAQSAANWAALSDDERYNLQYRTAGDDKVRDDHAAMNGITQPKKSAFWLSYYPPNGWRCRCIAVLVLASKYPATDLNKAIAAGEIATTQLNKNGVNKLEMFRFNPGMEKRVFPAGNAYEKVVGAEKIKDKSDSPLNEVIDKLKNLKIDFNEVASLKTKLTEDEIISKVGGGDLTKGSCSSLSFAYAGNKLGFDVLDFRDGESRYFFALNRNIQSIAAKVGGFIEKNVSDFKAISQLLTKVETDKEYILITGSHSSVIRKHSDNGLEYLELQSPISNGYKRLTNDVLAKRFGCKKSRTFYKQKYEAESMLIDIEKMDVEGFDEMLGYINTKAEEQKKGVRGRTR